MSSSKAKGCACSILLVWFLMMYQWAVNGCGTIVGRQIKRAEGGQISSTTLLSDSLVISMKKNMSACNLRGAVLSHHLSYVSVKGRRRCVIGLSGSSRGTNLSVMSIVRWPVMLVFVGNQYVESNYKSRLNNWHCEPSNIRIPLMVLQNSTSVILTYCLVHLCPVSDSSP